MSSFSIKQGDRLPDLVAYLELEDGTALDLTLASSVTFRMWQQKASGAAFKVSAAATVVDATTGKVRYSWGASDTDTIGVFLAEFVIVWPGSKNQTVPTRGAFKVQVVDAGLPG